MAEVLRDAVVKVEVSHRKHYNGEYFGDGAKRYARLVLWATTARGYRVWVITIEGGLDATNNEDKILLAEMFFQGLIGKEIEFSHDVGRTWSFAEIDSIPGEFLVSYAGIKSAIAGLDPKMYSGRICELITRLRKNRKQLVAKAAILEKDLRERLIEEQEERKRDYQRRLEVKRKEEEEAKKSREKAPKLSFVKGYNPKYGTERWEARRDGRIFVLRREDAYRPEEGEVPVRHMFDLVPGRILLMERI